MKMIVCIKQVPDTNEVRIDPKTGTLIRDGVESIINPEDRHGLEAAIALKEMVGGKITVVTMGPPQAKDALREALAMGADEAILLSDRAFAGADTLATSTTLAAAVEKIDDYDLIFCGHQAIDGDTAQVGPQLAEHLGLPQVTFVNKLELEAEGLDDDADQDEEIDYTDQMLIAIRKLEDGEEIVKVQLPALVTVVAEINEPRYPSVRGLINAFNEDRLKTWTNEDLGLDTKNLGLNGSPTQVRKTFTPESERKGEVCTGSAKEQADALIRLFREKKVI